MNNNERKIFWETLCLLRNDYFEEDAIKLSKTIKTPHFLYRYRDVNSKTLEALKTNSLYFSSANYYDDPFDTFLHIDIDSIKKEIIEELKDDKTVQNFLDKFNSPTFKKLRQLLGLNGDAIINVEMFRNFFNEKTLENIIKNIGEFRNIIKSDTWSICFSENGKNESLWLKYANQHKGFVLEYDIKSPETNLCGTRNECNNCVMKNLRYSLYPIYYSNFKYDATIYSKFILKHYIEDKLGTPGLFNKVLSFSNSQCWEREKISLIKKECHKYDEEWRLITVAPPNSCLHVQCKPSKLILGLKMEPHEESLVISLAKQAGISSIYKSYIRNDGELDFKPILGTNLS